MTQNDDNLTQPAGPGTRVETVVEYVDVSRQRRILGALLVVLVILLGITGWFLIKLVQPPGAPDAAQLPNGITWVRSIYAYGKGVENMLNGPVDVAVGPDGTIWTISAKHTIVAFTPEGRPVRVIRSQDGTATGQVKALEGITVAEDGTLYLADYGANKIIAMDPTGRFLREWGVQLPNEVAERDGKVAVVAAYGMGVFDTQGTLLAKWGGRGQTEDKFDLPHGVAIAGDGTIYVSDTQNRRVKAYTQDGRLLWTLGKPLKGAVGTATAEAEPANGVSQTLQLPAGMTLDGRGRICLVDPFLFEIVVIDPSTHQIVERYGENGTADGVFGYPTGIAYDARRDWFVVADTANNRLQIVRLPGTGGSEAIRLITRSLDGPIWLCATPLALLVLAAWLVVVRRRRARS